MKLFLQLITALVLTLSMANAQKAITDSFFDKVNFSGAIGKVDWTAKWSNFQPDTVEYAATTETVSGHLTGTINWTADKVYLLSGFVYVDTLATLNIAAGTVIRGDKGTMGSLIIKRGAKINAIGTADSPIVFTSNIDAGSRKAGDWGGLIICGKAKINQAGGQMKIEGGPDAYYGGDADDDNSGTLQYVRVEFAGYPFLPDKEINGITFGGVGSATTVNYCQVSYCNDDSYEWFGGTVNCKHLIAFRGVDDEFDTDFGYSGMVQFAIGLRDPQAADKSQSNGFESDNDASGSDLIPQTNAVFSNFTLVGPKKTASDPASINAYFKRAMHIRRNSALNVYNSVFMGWPIGLVLDGSKSEANAETSGKLKMKHNVMAGMTINFGIGKTSTTVEDSIARINKVRDFYKNTDNKNDTFATNAEVKITDAFNLDEPNFMPMTESVLLTKSIWYPVADETDAIENNSILNNNTINVFPNPVYSQLQISNAAVNSRIEIINVVGQIVKSSVLNQSNTVDVSLITNGVYFLNVYSNSNVSTIKFIKK